MTDRPSSFPSDPLSDRFEPAPATALHDTAAADIFSGSEWTSSTPVDDASAVSEMPGAESALTAWRLEDDDILPKRSSAKSFFAFRR